MQSTPQIHNRRSIRLKGYDYSLAGAYFITICTDDRKCIFGHVAGAQMVLNEYGTIAYNEWNNLNERFPNFELDVFQIMPNHIHGIIVLTNPIVGAGFAPAPNAPNPQNNMQVGFTSAQNKNSEISNRATHPHSNRATASVAPTNATVGNIVGAYKSLVANKCLNIFKQKWAETKPIPRMDKLWQRNYYENIIRDEKSYQNISNYILNNPKNWKDDKFYNS